MFLEYTLIALQDNIDHLDDILCWVGMKVGGGPVIIIQLSSEFGESLIVLDDLSATVGFLSVTNLQSIRFQLFPILSSFLRFALEIVTCEFLFFG